jgi:hypothetical protein
MAVQNPARTGQRRSEWPGAATPSSIWTPISASARADSSKTTSTPNTVFNLLCEAIAGQEQRGEGYALFGSRTAVIEQIEAGRALGVQDTFGLSRVNLHDDMECGST